MKIILPLLIVSFLLVSVIAVSATSLKFCTDSDGGSNVWSGGIATTEKGNDVDDCDGASENLKEFTCDGDKSKVDNIKCSDFDAVCVSDGDKSVPDYCACENGYEFSQETNTCIEVSSSVPEFSVIAAIMTLGIVIVGFFLLRKQ